VRRPWTGAVGKSAPMDGGYLPHGTNTPNVGSRIQDQVRHDEFGTFYEAIIFLN